ncbi:hypothetical protein GCM10011376_25520 [Nocardioides flavus (ex Wang et al. 2016)]|uniref:Uncharacterized protein n=1 Tax=Nocardioides flavus (ex Wang et al. 2016) TaxID=2058780 RepID=A0ABQ3HND8_9ACTN|nr:hypothetical protein [Nocardioides flavus (ex Wang et al. 2016)]GHE17942.1 hypothetical protein GCM10011376_25520 [Nocardioides flavus (ex Wang et al. 2016)]
MKRTTRTATSLAALSLGVATVVLAPAAAQARPDTDCMRAGLAALKGEEALPSVAASGLPISTAVALGVEPREGTDVGSLPDPLPLSVVLADHRAGDDSLFIYPWC